MLYNEKLLNRVREKLSPVSDVEERQKMGGISFIVNGKMCVRVYKDDLMLRCEPEMTDQLLLKRGVSRFKMKGKPAMKGWLWIGPEATTGKKEFDYWMQIALDNNKKLRSAKK